MARVSSQLCVPGHRVPASNVTEVECLRRGDWQALRVGLSPPPPAAAKSGGQRVCVTCVCPRISPSLQPRDGGTVSAWPAGAPERPGAPGVARVHCGGPRSEPGRVSLRARPPGPRGRCPRPVVPPFGADARAVPEHHEQRPCGASSSPRRVSASRGPALGGAERRNLSGSRGRSRQPGALRSPRVARRPRSREPRGSGNGSLWDPAWPAAITLRQPGAGARVARREHGGAGPLEEQGSAPHPAELLLPVSLGVLRGRKLHPQGPHWAEINQNTYLANQGCQN